MDLHGCSIIQKNPESRSQELRISNVGFRNSNFGFRFLISKFEFPKTNMYLTPQDIQMSLLPSRDWVAIRHPGQVPPSGTRAWIQKEPDYIELSLDSGARPPLVDSSGMTASANCDIVYMGRRSVARISWLIVAVELSALCF